MLRRTVLNEKAVPGGIGNLESCIYRRCRQEPPEILRKSPNKTGNRPPQSVKNHRCFSPAHFVCNDSSDESKKHLQKKPHSKRCSDFQTG